MLFSPAATQVFPAQDMDGKMFFPKPPPKRQLANPIALAALVDLLASEEEAVLHPALTLLVTVVRGGLEIPLSAGARGRIVVRCLRHACEGRCAELCAELLGAEAVAAPPSRLSDGGMGGAGGFLGMGDVVVGLGLCRAEARNSQQQQKRPRAERSHDHTSLVAVFRREGMPRSHIFLLAFEPSFS